MTCGMFFCSPLNSFIRSFSFSGRVHPASLSQLSSDASHLLICCDLICCLFFSSFWWREKEAKPHWKRCEVRWKCVCAVILLIMGTSFLHHIFLRVILTHRSECHQCTYQASASCLHCVPCASEYFVCAVCFFHKQRILCVFLFSFTLPTRCISSQNAVAGRWLGFLVKMNTFNILNEREQLGVNALRIQITSTMNQCYLFFALFNRAFEKKIAQRQMAWVSVSVKLKQSNDNDDEERKIKSAKQPWMSSEVKLIRVRVMNEALVIETQIDFHWKSLTLDDFSSICSPFAVSFSVSLARFNFKT